MTEKTDTKTTKLLNARSVLKTIPFDVEECNVSFKGAPVKHKYHRLRINDWVNVLPITSDGKVILIRQDRVGAEENILETPGGVLDPEDQDQPEKAALRELEEETGYTSNEIISLGKINPNPAINTNYVHYYIAKNAYIPSERKHFPDLHEHVENVIVELALLPDLLKNNQINHALSALLVYKALDYLKI